jgi:hypothetical protein
VETRFGPGAVHLCLMTQKVALEKFSVPVYQIFPWHYQSKIDPHSFFLNPPLMQYDIRHCSFGKQNFSLALEGLLLLCVPSTFGNTLRGFNASSITRLNKSAHTHRDTHARTHKLSNFTVETQYIFISPDQHAGYNRSKICAVNHYNSVYKSEQPCTI